MSLRFEFSRTSEHRSIATDQRKHPEFSLKPNQDIANDVKLIFKAENKAVALQLARDTIARYETKASKAMDCLENGLEDGIAVLLLPQRYRQRLRTSNLAERVAAVTIKNKVVAINQ